MLDKFSIYPFESSSGMHYETKQLFDAPRTMVWQEVTPVNHWIAERFVWVIDADFGADTPPYTLRCTSFHFLETS
jgi:hypothetical protein